MRALTDETKKASKASFGPLNKWRSMPVEARASAAYFVCSVLQRGLSLVTLPLFARILSKYEYGQAVIYSSWESLLTIFITLNLAYGSFNAAMVKFETERSKYLAAVNGVVIALASFFVLVYLPFSGLLNPLFELPTWIMLLMVLGIVTTNTLQCWYSMQRFEYRYRSVVLVTLGTSVPGVVFAIVLVLLAANGWRGYARIVGAAIPGIIFGLAIAVRLFVREKTFYNRELWKWALSFNLPLVPYYISQMLFNQSDRIMISHLVSTEAAAMYGIAYSLAMILTFVLNAINGAYVPWLYGKIRDKRMRDNQTVCTGIAALMALLLLLVIATAPEIILVMASEKYVEACWVVGPVAMSLIFHFYTQLFVNVQFYYEEKWLLVAGALVAGVSNVVLNWLLIPVYGYIAASYTTLLSFFLMAFMNWVMYRTVLKRRGLEDELFSYPLLISIAIALLVLGFLMMALYGMPVIRYGLVGMMLLTGVVFKNKILDMIKKLRGREAG